MPACGSVIFSARLNWDTRPNRLSELLARKRQDGVRVLDLTESNPTHAGFRYPGELLAGFRDPRMLVYDPASAGLLAAREQVAGLCRVDADRVVLTT
ncbi:MAG: aminotransferase, partial [Bryobacterales bacterium]|nr:aminotransferase [Bryobacterales bacterium]